ncbi:MAG: hypothetical protein Q7S51_10985 [Gallionellaceae bacterium]|nr:hypothetical protein [Gallionellaceae bacterium]
MKSLSALCAMLLVSITVTTTVVAAESAPGKTKTAPADAINKQYPNVGVVIETIDTDLYTYIELSGKTDKDPSVWLAASKTKVAKGDTIRYGEGAVMSNFHSKTLNKTFPTITFVEKVMPVTK